MEVTKSDIVTGLQELGLNPGDKVLVHSSLSSFGYVKGGAEVVISALLDTVCPGGTILVPTLTGDETLSSDNPPYFDPQSTPCWTGLIPETFRQMAGAVRSLHPTHSVAAIGYDAGNLTEEHIDSLTPCDEGSPYGKLAKLEDGYILLIGVDHESCTMLHHVEEVAGVDYHLQHELACARIKVGDQTIHRNIFLHRYGTRRNFNAIEPLLLERGIQRQTIIGFAPVRLIHVKRMVEIVLYCLRADPDFLILRTLED